MNEKVLTFMVIIGVYGEVLEQSIFFKDLIMCNVQNVADNNEMEIYNKKKIRSMCVRANGKMAIVIYKVICLYISHRYAVSAYSLLQTYIFFSYFMAMRELLQGTWPTIHLFSKG